MSHWFDTTHTDAELWRLVFMETRCASDTPMCPEHCEELDLHGHAGPPCLRGQEHRGRHVALSLFPAVIAAWPGQHPPVPADLTEPLD